jgi:hypothetical protein
MQKLIELFKLSDWYRIKKSHVLEAGGLMLFSKYSSLEEALRDAYPDYPWQPSLFQPDTYRRYWKDAKRRKERLEIIGKELGVKEVYQKSFFSYVYLFIFVIYSYRIGMKYQDDSS